MSFALYQYPKQAAFNRILPKSKIYEHANPKQSIRDLFVTQIQKIIWAYKLSPETINLNAKPEVPEIQIFDIQLKTHKISEEILRCIDKAIPLPIIFQLKFENSLQIKFAYKRPNEADESKWVLDQYLSSPWLSETAQAEAISPMPIALDMRGLYEQMIKELIPLNSRSGENLKEQSERLNLVTSEQIAIVKIEAKINKEKQFNRKVELNAELRKLKAQLAQLSE
jgi:hypothetical protein